MRIGVLGTGMVGRAFSMRLKELGHQVMVGARSAESESLADVAAPTGSFADVAAHGELLINAVNGEHTLAAIGSCADADLAGKTLIDVSNVLDPSRGMARAALAGQENSTAAAIQERWPELRVVKSFNTINCNVMVDPTLVPGVHVVFISGDDADAKQQVKDLQAEFGWRPEQILDLGGIETATGPELYMQLWLDIAIARGGFDKGPFNIAINAG
jgi:predicted dinucleotide-binding enzyme